ncbi:MAG: hypothetical protein DWQ34_00395 [Planctomycetota bacterium]|nr:MAG: hypothetical protein DWQ29_21205 [Planctomycetota bacterium]REJ98479.1 MAG: hypothetical protein DWQ34_00395 [Planctomycetota bacterium]REK23606.1 MAG: hypothetical protein DWQ41_16330 [Planctomycetota bacterium]REK31168.1 MAG: hypothetical protein DWQ45_20200 [Planctomycetota bacterium]
MRSLAPVFLSLLTLALSLQVVSAAGDETGGRDPFLVDYEGDAYVGPAVEQAGYEAAAPIEEGGVFPEGRIPADSAGSNPGGRVRVETSHPYLFPNEAEVRGPVSDEDWTYPDDTQPVQYPLDDDAYRGMPDAYPGYAPPPTYAPPVMPPVAPARPTGPFGWKSRKASLTHVFGGDDSLGISTLDVRGTMEFPSAPGLFVTPQFGLHLLDGPSATDLPARLYDGSLDFSIYRPVGDAWMLNLSIAPSLYTDGENLSSDALRIIGRFMAYYTVSPQLQWAGGIVYLDREDIPVLPAIGAIYKPRDDLRYELMFPKPRIAWRQYFTPTYEQWVYVTGELGGQSWAIERTTGLDDIASYRDLRFILGVERKMTTGRVCYFEFGYVFNREIEYDSGVGNMSLSDTGFLRIGGSF